MDSEEEGGMALRMLFHTVQFLSLVLTLVITGSCLPYTDYMSSPYEIRSNLPDVLSAASLCLDLKTIEKKVGESDLVRLIFSPTSEPETPPQTQQHPEPETPPQTQQHRELKELIEEELLREDPYIDPSYRTDCPNSYEKKEHLAKHEKSLLDLLDQTDGGKKAMRHLAEHKLDDLLKSKKYPVPATVRWALLIGEALENHSGMRLYYHDTFNNDTCNNDTCNKDTCNKPCVLSIEQERRRMATGFRGFWECLSITGLPSCWSKSLWYERNSISYDEPISLALSARILPDSKAEKAISKPDSKPEKAISNVLEDASREIQPSFSEQQRIEITISTAINTAGIDDRIQYVSAYLVIPPFPRVTQGNFDLEETFIRYLRSYSLGRSPNRRLPMLRQDIRTALQDLTVHFSNVDSIQTKLKEFELGTLQSTLGISAEGGPSDDPSLKVTPNAGSVRTEKLFKEIERRSVWLSSDRRLLRITQRGHEYVSVAGTVTETITLKIPRKPLLSLDFTDLTDLKKGSKDAIPPVPIYVKKGWQPVYRLVDGLVLIIGTARMVAPTRTPSLKEPNGYAYSVLHGPIPVRLWEYESTQHYRLDVYDLFASLQRKAIGELAVVVKVGAMIDYAQFHPIEKYRTFLSKLGHTIGLQKVIQNSKPDEAWFRIVKCPAKGSVNEAELTEKDVLLGLQEFDGSVRGFKTVEYEEYRAGGKPYCPAK
jgi:hypothetical protein